MHHYKVMITFQDDSLFTTWVKSPSSEKLTEYLENRYKNYKRHVILEREKVDRRALSGKDTTDD